MSDQSAGWIAWLDVPDSDYADQPAQPTVRLYVSDVLRCDLTRPWRNAARFVDAASALQAANRCARGEDTTCGAANVDVLLKQS